jgi:hypothetical protein
MWNRELQLTIDLLKEQAWIVHAVPDACGGDDW